MKKLTIEEVKDKILKINPDIEIISDVYINSGTKLKCRCKIDEHEWENSFSHLSSGQKCPKCRGLVQLSLEQIKEDLLIINPNIEILSNIYINNSGYLDMRCKIDGHLWKAKWMNLKSGKGCPVCGKSMRSNLDDVKKKVFKINPGIEIISKEYLNSKTKLKLRCLADLYEWEALSGNLFKGCGCPKCGGTAKWTIEKIKQEITSISPNILILSNEYINSDSNLKCKCLLDGYEWDAKWKHLISGHGCPLCNSSKGEKSVSKYLEDKGIIYEPQKVFDHLLGLKGKNLSYDFYLPNQNLLIEYQGEFHDGNGNQYVKSKLQTQQEHDKRKRDYAEFHDIKLLEIWYWDYDNIETILNQYLIK